MSGITSNKKNLRVDIVNNCLYLRSQSIPLTEKEKRLLYFLMDNQGKVVGHSEICNAVWPERSTVIGPNNILQLIFRLRIKLKSLGVDNGISTITGKGYQLDVQILPVSHSRCPGLKVKNIVLNFKRYITTLLVSIIAITIISHYIRIL